MTSGAREPVAVVGSLFHGLKLLPSHFPRYLSAGVCYFLSSSVAEANVKQKASAIPGFVFSLVNGRAHPFGELQETASRDGGVICCQGFFQNMSVQVRNSLELVPLIESTFNIAGATLKATGREVASLHLQKRYSRVLRVEGVKIAIKQVLIL